MLLRKLMKLPNQNNEEEVIPETEVLEEAFRFEPSALCKYKQRGIYLVCTSCELQHATYIGINKIMIGEDEHGKPILEDRGLNLK